MYNLFWFKPDTTLNWRADMVQWFYFRERDLVTCLSQCQRDQSQFFSQVTRFDTGSDLISNTFPNKELTSLNISFVMVHRILNLGPNHVSELVSNEAWANKSRISRDLTLAQSDFDQFPYLVYPLSLIGLNNPMILLAGTHIKTEVIPPPSPHCLRFCQYLNGRSHHPFCTYISSAVSYLVYQHPALLRTTLIELKTQILTRHPEIAFEGWQEVMRLKFDSPPDAPSSINQVLAYMAYWEPECNQRHHKPRFMTCNIRCQEWA